mgnify:CR=1 FL=1
MEGTERSEEHRVFFCPSSTSALPGRVCAHILTLPSHQPLTSRESAKWRGTLEGESGAWREFVKAEIHAMGLA